MKLTAVFVFLTVQILLLSGCGGIPYDGTLPNANELGTPRTLQIARTITHFHSPYSYDACDKTGVVNGQLDQRCLNSLKYAMCKSRVNYLFLSDHPENMANYGMQDLLLHDSTKDTLILKAGLPYANQVGSCDNQFTPTLLVGFESKLMAMGMTKHLDPDIAIRTGLYNEETNAIKGRLDTETEAIVAIPHTESRSFNLINTIDPHAIEIYNIHANVDPKIRNKDLNWSPFEDLPGILTYLFDPFKQLIPDFMFMHFVSIHPIYFTRWNQLVSAGKKVAGIIGTDSHENIFPQGGSDNERLDAHRRLARMASNHVLVNSLDADSVKTSIKAARFWTVFEGLGSPVNMDFYSEINGSTVGVGDTGSIGAGNATFHVIAPTLHSASPRGNKAPEIRVVLKKVNADGTDSAVASSIGTNLSYETTQTGVYRAEIMIRPHHLKEFLSDFSKLSEDEYYWIITNHIYVTP
jgi:hypothetical protein